MPELKPLPCPYCGSTYIYVRGRSNAQVTCRNCGMEGPEPWGNNAAIAAWNSLPRALTWATEPKLGEWNWWGLDDVSKMPRYVFLDGTIDTTMMGRIPWQDIGGQWAGQITPPREES